MDTGSPRRQRSGVRKVLRDVIKARLGAYGEFDPSPESIESDVRAFLEEKYGSTFEIDSIEREGFAHEMCVLFAHPAGDPDALVRVEWNPRTAGISESPIP